MKSHLKKIIVFFIFFGWSFSGNAASAAGVNLNSGEEGVPVTVQNRLAVAPTLAAVLTCLKDEFAKRRSTWTLLKEGEDGEGKKQSVKALEELRTWALEACYRLTGLTTDDGKRLRIKDAFFHDPQQGVVVLYRGFKERLRAHIAVESEKCTFTAKKAEIYARYLVYAAQRERYFEALVTDACKEGFEKGGMAQTFSKLTLGITEKMGLNRVAGDYIYSKNANLALFAVQPEEYRIAADVVRLLKEFHDPLSLGEEIDYGPYKPVSAQPTEGALSLAILKILMGKPEFWEGSYVPAVLSTSSEREKAEGAGGEASVAGTPTAAVATGGASKKKTEGQPVERK